VIERPVVADPAVTPAVTEVDADGVPLVRRRRWF
jgi:hypothetical protein